MTNRNKFFLIALTLLLIVFLFGSYVFIKNRLNNREYSSKVNSPDTSSKSVNVPAPSISTSPTPAEQNIINPAPSTTKATVKPQATTKRVNTYQTTVTTYYYTQYESSASASSGVDEKGNAWAEAYAN